MSVGASAGEIVCAGIDHGWTNKDPQTGKAYQWTSFSLGAGLGSPIECHGQAGWTFGLYDLKLW